MKVRVIKNIDNTVSIIYPAPKSKRLDETEEQWLERIFAKANPNNLPFNDIDTSELPRSRRFRNIWRWCDNPGEIKINEEETKKIEEEEEIQQEIRRIKELERNSRREEAILNLKK